MGNHPGLPDRGGLGPAYPFPALSSAGASIARPCFRFHTPLGEPGVRISRTRLSDRDARPSALDSRPDAGRRPGCLNRFAEVIGSRHSPGSRAPSDALPELGPLPSAGVTRPLRYYEPVRHPTRPGLSLAGVRLRAATPLRVGLPVLPRVSSAGMLSPIPRWDRWVESFARRISHPLHDPATAAFPVRRAGRLPRHCFRGLLSVHYSLRPARSRGR